MVIIKVLFFSFNVRFERILKFMDSLFIVMPAYNEEDNIATVVKQWYNVLDNKSENSRLVVADSGSEDSTHDILLELKEQLPKLEILSDTLKQHGPKVIALYDFAINHGADYIFQTDSDGQTCPEEFQIFWGLRENFSGIFGYRNIREDGKSRAFVEHVVCFLIKLYFGVKIPDANAPFRLMKADTVKKYLYKLPKDYNLPNVMMTTYFVYYKESVMFKTITFKPRQGGKNSIDILKIINTGKRALIDFKILKKGI